MNEECLRTLPRKLKIGAYDWSVVVEYVTSDTNCGLADFEVHKLSLWSENLTSPGHVVGIVLHECLHVIFDNQGLGKMKRDKEEREEAIIMGFEAGLVSLFRDNPKMVTWMKRWLR